MPDELSRSVRKIRTFADDFARSQPQVGGEEAGAVVTAPKPKPTTTPLPTALKETGLKKASAPVSIKQKTPTIAMRPSRELLDDVSDIETGSIVRDTRRSNFKLFPAIGASVSSWFTDKQEKRKAASMAVPTMTAPTTRKEVIANAASLGVLPESDDHERITVRLKENPRQAVKTSVAIAGREAEPVPKWGSRDEDVTEASEELHDEAVSALEEAVAPPKEVEPENAQAVSSELSTSTKEIVPLTEPTREEEPLIETYVREEEPSVTEPEPTERNFQRQEVTNIPEVEEEPVFSPDPSTSYQFKSPAQPNISRTNPGLFVLLLVVILALVLGAFGTVALYRHFTTPGVLLVPRMETVLRADYENSFVLDSELRANLETMRLNAAGGVGLYYPTILTSENTVIPATITELLARDTFGIPAAFSRSLTEMSFGTVGSEPFILIVTNNFDIAFAGMLEWESTMSSDLNFWFGSNPSASFIDTTSSNRDIRVSKRGDGSELMYTFVNRTTILITSSRTVISEIPPRVTN